MTLTHVKKALTQVKKADRILFYNEKDEHVATLTNMDKGCVLWVTKNNDSGREFGRSAMHDAITKITNSLDKNEL